MKKKSRRWPSAGLEVGRAAAVDLVGGGGDHRARRLAEDLGQPHDRHRAGGDQVLERLAGADRRQLVGVADEDDVGRLGEALEQHLGEAQVQHRGLVDDHQVGGQGVAGTVGRLATRHPLEQAVDRHRLVAGRLLHPPRRAPGRRAERQAQARRLGLGDDPLRAERLADARAAGEDRDAGGEGAAHRRPLLVGQPVAAVGFARLLAGVVVELGRLRRPLAQRRRHRHLAGQGRLAVDGLALEDEAGGAGEHLGIGGEPEQPRRALGQLGQRQEAVALLLGLGQRVDGGRLRPPGRLRRHVGGERDLVGAGEADAGHLGQPVGVLVQDGHRALAEAGVDRRRQVGEAVRRQLHVEVADGAARVPRFGRRRSLVLADAAQRGEDPLRVGGDRRQHALAVLVDQPLGPGAADVAQRGQVGDLPLAVGGVERHRALGAELAAVARVGLPLAADLGPVALAEVGHRPDQGEAFARLGLAHLEHRVAVVLGAEDDAEHLDGAAVGGGVGVEQGRGSVHPSKARPR